MQVKTLTKSLPSLPIILTLIFFYTGKSLQKLDMVKAIYADKTELLKRESMGIVTQDMASVFKTKYVDALFSKQRYKLIKEPLFVFIGCDPNGGGT
tara:strand:- start:950 stop:1237 length:288 start_codon:yes stop_codon:yes gene_type:complete